MGRILTNKEETTKVIHNLIDDYADEHKIDLDEALGEIARKMNMIDGGKLGPSNIVKYYSGENLPTIKSLEKFAQAVGTTPYKIMDSAKEMSETAETSAPKTDGKVYLADQILDAYSAGRLAAIESFLSQHLKYKDEYSYPWWIDDLKAFIMLLVPTFPEIAEKAKNAATNCGSNGANDLKGVTDKAAHLENSSSQESTRQELCESA